MTTVVFVGPTLPAAQVQALLPTARVCGPAQAGDILRTVCGRRRPTQLVLIDGLFERMAAPWHKELLLAMERGIAVAGAASMGALRAAELAPHGMVGVGQVFQGYARGAISSDAEVAVAHAPASHGYAPATVAQVNVRFGVAALVRRGVLAAADAAAVQQASARIFYRERDLAAVLDAARAAGVGARALARLARAWRGGVPDQKAADARALLRRLARAPLPVPPRQRCERTWALRTFAAQLDLRLPS